MNAWTDSLLALVKREAHAILCIGNVNDAFPSAISPAKLDSWCEAVNKTLASQYTLRWTFDPVNGFGFEDEQSQQLFRNLAGMSQRNSPANPIEAARQALEQNEELTKDSYPAFELMLKAFKAARADNQRCLAILPNFDAICPATPPLGQTETWRLALAFADYAQNEEMRRAQNLIVASSPASASIDARLRRTDIPLPIVKIGKPNEAERYEQLSRLAQLAKRHADEAIIREQIQRLSSQRSELEAQSRTSHQAMIDIVRPIIASQKNQTASDSIQDILSQCVDSLPPAKKRELENATRTADKHIQDLTACIEKLSQLEAELPETSKKAGGVSASQFFSAVNDAELAKIARLTQGFGYRQLRDLLIALAEAPKDKLNETLAVARKDILARSYGHLLDIIEPSYGFEGIAGLDGIKEFLLGVKKAIEEGDLRRVPMGCLLIGPPGTGKTAIAEGFARECGMTFLKLRNIRSMWIGESERQMEEVLVAIRELAPAVVLRDEVDEEDSGRDSFQGDSGTSARIRREWMTFLSDPSIRGRVFVMSCTNRPDRLDPALKRSGRTDERIPVLMPDAETREALFEVMIRRNGYKTKLKGFAHFSDKTEGLSGADIEVIVRHAYEFSPASDGITAEALERAIDDFIPSASQDEIARMTQSAIKETSSRRFLPKEKLKPTSRTKVGAN